MRPSLALACLCPVLLVGCAGEAEEVTALPPRAAAPVVAPEVAAEQLAHGATALLMGTLLPELQAALAAGGPANAVTVCSTRAQELTANIGKAQKISIRRTALKVRNPDNTPDEFERGVLEAWLAGEPEPVSQLVDAPDGTREMRTMTPIPTGALCIQCHGPQEGISDEVKMVLAQEYPDDQATGFAEGSLRGAVSVRVPVRKN